MRKLSAITIPAISLFFLAAVAAGAKIIYVDADAAGADDGSSWGDAYNFLTYALRDASGGDEIRVAQGTYRPNEGIVAIPEFDWRTTTFQLISGVTVKGGYAGFGEPDPNARDVELYETVLSGDLEGDDVDANDPAGSQDETTRAENSYHVVTGSGTDETAVLDGFTMTAGHALGPTPNPYDPNAMLIRSQSNGGGMYNNEGSPKLSNCTFDGNFAKSYGGGMCNDSNSRPKLSKCSFSRNRASIGGGISNSHDCDVFLSDCTFYGNSANHGGAIISENESDLVASDCIFSENSATSVGGAIFSHSNELTLINCLFSGNLAGIGGGVYNEGCRLSFEDCTFAGNAASGLEVADTGYGGGLCSEWNPPGSKIENCVFIGNIASSGGGAHFGYRGMAVPLSPYDKALLTGCSFVRNRASLGGAISQGTSALDIEHCVLRENSALHAGGAISNLSSITTLDHCIFSGNCASHGGASILAQGSEEVTMHGHKWPQNFVIMLDSCTFRANRTAVGQSLACTSHGSEDLDNTLIWNCILNNGGNEVSNPNGSQITIGYTNLCGGVSSIEDPCDAVIWAEGNIDSDPLFADPGYWADANDTSVIVEPNDPNADWIDGDYHLKSQAGRYDPNPPAADSIQDNVTSPCIDAGDPKTPVGREPFPNGGVVNMGAYGGTAQASKSYFGRPVCETIVAGDINGDCKVDFKDFVLLAYHWQEDNSP